MRTPLAIVGLGGVFPDAPDLDAFWNRVVSATPARSMSLAEMWGLPQASYQKRISMDRGFALPLEQASTRDRQIAFGRRAISAALKDAGPGVPAADTALVVAVSGAPRSYYCLDSQETEGAVGPEGQLRMLAEPSEIGGVRMGVDTACASSLYALNLAQHLIETARARRVVVVGLNAVLTPSLYVGFTKLGALSPQGTMRPFANDAAGIVPAECAAAVVVEAAADAVAEGRTIAACIAGIGLSSDGCEGSIFSPGVKGQQLAYARAWQGLDPGTADYVEAHGTATLVGDDTELRSLDAFFGPHRTRPLAIGSVKALYGHSLAAAGITSLIKATLMLRARVLPGRGAAVPSKALSRIHIELPTESRSLPETPGRPIRMGISGFGFGGANAHIVLESAPTQVAKQRPKKLRTPPPNHTRFAVVDLESRFGRAPGFGSPHPERFGFASSGDCANLGQGSYLPPLMQIEGAGLRTGPRLLERVDPLQLLVTETVGRILARSSFDSAETGIAMISNLGGELGLRIARQHARTLGSESGEACLTPEHIASSMPTMCSGYPAYHFDLHAFHETLAGEAGVFLDTLGCVPGWFEHDCRALLLGAAHMLKTGDDIRAASGLAFAEGAAVLLLRPWDEAESRGDRVLAVLDLSAPEGAPFDEEIVCQLLPDAPRGKVQTSAGYLGEATGIETLIHAVTAGPKKTRIVFQRGSSTVGSVHVERTEHEQESRAASAPAVPVDLRFGAKEIKAAAVAEEEVATKPADAFQQAGDAMLAFYKAQTTVMQVAQLREPAELDAVLAVNEADPYFFDHPLDHVPGILLVDGLQRLLDQAEGQWWQGEGDGEMFVSELSLRFLRWSEKGPPIRLRLSQEDGNHRFRFEASQNGKVVVRATGGVGWAQCPPSVLHDVHTRRTAGLKDVRKHRPENVAVSPLESRSDGTYLCETVRPPKHHYLRTRPGHSMPMLFLLEANRQMGRLVQAELGISVDQPANLISMHLEQSSTIPWGADLRLEFVPSNVRTVDGTVLVDANVRHVTSAGNHGRMRLQSQVVGVETYLAQRGGSR